MAVLSAEEKGALLADGGQHSVFDPAEGDDVGDLPYEDLFKDAEDCGPNVNNGVVKRVNSTCTKRPAKKQFSSIQKKYLSIENGEFLKAPQVNPKLWDDLLDKTRSRECSFQSLHFLKLSNFPSPGYNFLSHNYIDGSQFTKFFP